MPRLQDRLAALENREKAIPYRQAVRDPIDFYFDFVSPFGWIAAERISCLANQIGRSVSWRPVLLKSMVVDRMGLPPMIEIPLKGAYAIHDARRSARYHGLQMATDAGFAFASVAALRAVLWCKDAKPDSVGELVLALYRKQWVDGGDISSINAVVTVALNLGLTADELAGALLNQPLKAMLRDETIAAMTKGIFGSPTTVVAGELFWGADRLDMAIEWASRGGW